MNTEIDPVEWLQTLCDRWHEAGAPPSHLNEAIAVKQAVEAQTAESSGQWVSVEDRLPDETCVVWAVKKGSDVVWPYAYRMPGEYWACGFRSLVNDLEQTNITHWMPAPKAPVSSQQEPSDG